MNARGSVTIHSAISAAPAPQSAVGSELEASSVCIFTPPSEREVMRVEGSQARGLGGKVAQRFILHL